METITILKELGAPTLMLLICTCFYLAVRHDIALFKKEVRHDIALFKKEVRTDIESFKQGMRSDMEAFKQGMRSDMEAFKQGMRSDMDSFQREIRTDMSSMKRDVLMLKIFCTELPEQLRLSAYDEYKALGGNSFVDNYMIEHGLLRR